MTGFFVVFLCFLIGATMSVPGVSGGTTALCLGCYGKILTATANLKRKGSFGYLLRLGIGGISGFFLAAKLLNFAFQQVPLMMTLIFCAAAGTGLILPAKDSIKKFSLNGIICFLLGLISVLAVEKLPQGMGNESILLSALWGIFLAAGIILPGVSTSHLLLVFGLYDDVASLSRFQDLLPLIPLGVGAVVGIVLLTKPLALAWEKNPDLCRSLILGFATGSLKALWEPCLQNSNSRTFLWGQICLGLAISAFAVWGILKLNRVEEMKKM